MPSPRWLPLPIVDDVEIARLAADAMWAADAASQALGMTLVEVAPGRAVASMAIRPDMVNGLDVCHGGLVFSLADTAMAFASNSKNVQTFATNAGITWLRPARLGDVLTATAGRTGEAGRTETWHVDVVNQEGDDVAVFDGVTRSNGRPIVSTE